MKRVPKLPVTPHPFIPEPGAGADYHGRVPCFTCHIPDDPIHPQSRAHQADSPADDSDRITGDRDAA